ncbi:hypothetical protein [Streptomyces sp. NPDC016845]|uniref:hypothetical protein n=1 Tax=Streptomyces sp. NPDC016845 TaxID=3364972 RepID=UPI00379563D5
MTGIPAMDQALQQEALAELRQGMIWYLLEVAVQMLDGWARAAGDDVAATGELARRLVHVILSFTTDGADPDALCAFFAGRRVPYAAMVGRGVRHPPAAPAGERIGPCVDR